MYKLIKIIMMQSYTYFNDDSIEQLHRWLNDLELQLQTESQLQNTLQEKKLQFERVKVS
jgi:hypothetical protein